MLIAKILTIHIIKYWSFAVFLLTLLTFVRPARLGGRGKAVWTLLLLVCAARGVAYEVLGGAAQSPNLPESVLWIWDWACSGMFFLALLSAFWWVRRWRTLLLPVAAWGMAAVGFVNGIALPEVREVELSYADLPTELDGYRIAQLSDLHCSYSMRGWRTRGIVERINALEPDLVCMTGDYVDGLVKHLADDVAPLKDLRAKDGVYGVRGNHEYYRDIQQWRKWFKENGLRMLVNECVHPRRTLALAGVNDIHAGRHKDVTPNVRKAFAAATNGEFRVLMEHGPKFARVNIMRRGVRLQLSGHTHGGILPGIAQLIARRNRGFVRGLYEFPKGLLYVSPGVGQWAGFPLRFLNPTEITLITLRRK